MKINDSAAAPPPYLILARWFEAWAKWWWDDFMFLVQLLRNLRGYRRWFDPDQLPALREGTRIWIDVQNVAQLHVVVRFMNGLRLRDPNVRYVLSVESDACKAIAEEEVTSKDVVVYSPGDFSPILRRALGLVRPVCVIVTGNILKYHLIRLAKVRAIPVAWIGGELNPGDYEVWKESPRPVRESLVNSIDTLCVAFEAQKRRLVEAGFKSSDIHVFGCPKYDATGVYSDSQGLAERVLRALGIRDDHLILLGGSVWKGEDVILLDIYLSLRERFEDLVLLIAPAWHMPDLPYTIHEARKRGLNVAVRSQVDEHVNTSNPRPDVLLIDSVGELNYFYSLATVVFVGRSLTHFVGSNVIEPARWGKPVIVGPHMVQFEEVLDDFLSAQAIIQVQDQDALERAVADLLTSFEMRDLYGRRACRVISKKAGAIQKTVDHMSEFLHLRM